MCAISLKAWTKAAWERLIVQPNKVIRIHPAQRILNSFSDLRSSIVTLLWCFHVHSLVRSRFTTPHQFAHFTRMTTFRQWPTLPAIIDPYETLTSSCKHTSRLYLQGSKHHNENLLRLLYLIHSNTHFPIVRTKILHLHTNTLDSYNQSPLITA